LHRRVLIVVTDAIYPIVLQKQKGGGAMASNERKLMQAERISNQCDQCGNLLIAPAWSEPIGEERVRHLWNCDACGYSYETMVYVNVRAKAA